MPAHSQCELIPFQEGRYISSWSSTATETNFCAKYRQERELDGQRHSLFSSPDNRAIIQIWSGKFEGSIKTVIAVSVASTIRFGHSTRLRLLLSRRQPRNAAPLKRPSSIHRGPQFRVHLNRLKIIFRRAAESIYHMTNDGRTAEADERSELLGQLPQFILRELNGDDGEFRRVSHSHPTVRPPLVRAAVTCNLLLPPSLAPSPTTIVLPTANWGS